MWNCELWTSADDESPSDPTGPPKDSENGSTNWIAGKSTKKIATVNFIREFLHTLKATSASKNFTSVAPLKTSQRFSICDIFSNTTLDRSTLFRVKNLDGLSLGKLKKTRFWRRIQKRHRAGNHGYPCGLIRVYHI
jgi:hypothetical protein